MSGIQFTIHNPLVTPIWEWIFHCSSGTLNMKLEVWSAFTEFSPRFSAFTMHLNIVVAEVLSILRKWKDRTSIKQVITSTWLQKESRTFSDLIKCRHNFTTLTNLPVCVGMGFRLVCIIALSICYWVTYWPIRETGTTKKSDCQTLRNCGSLWQEWMQFLKKAEGPFILLCLHVWTLKSWLFAECFIEGYSWKVEWKYGEKKCAGATGWLLP